MEPVPDGGGVGLVVMLELAGGVVVLVVGAVAELSVGVPVEVDVLALVSVPVSDFLLHAVRPRLAAASSALAATRAVREDPVSI